MPTEDSTGARLRVRERATEWPLTGAAVVFPGAYGWEVLANAQGGAMDAAELVIDVVRALSTITTIGYGDTIPVSTEGRFIAALLMIGGVALIGVVTATPGSWIVSLVEHASTASSRANSSLSPSLTASLRSA